MKDQTVVRQLRAYVDHRRYTSIAPVGENVHAVYWERDAKRSTPETHVFIFTFKPLIAVAVREYLMALKTVASEAVSLVHREDGTLCEPMEIENFLYCVTYNWDEEGAQRDAAEAYALQLRRLAVFASLGDVLTSVLTRNQEPDGVETFHV